MDLKRLTIELRAEHAKLHRAIEDLERLYRIPPSAKAPRIVVKRIGRPRKNRDLVKKEAE